MKRLSEKKLSQNTTNKHWITPIISSEEMIEREVDACRNCKITRGGLHFDLCICELSLSQQEMAGDFLHSIGRRCEGKINTCRR